MEPDSIIIKLQKLLHFHILKFPLHYEKFYLLLNDRKQNGFLDSLRYCKDGVTYHSENYPKKFKVIRCCVNGDFCEIISFVEKQQAAKVRVYKTMCLIPYLLSKNVYINAETIDILLEAESIDSSFFYSIIPNKTVFYDHVISVSDLKCRLNLLLCCLMNGVL